MGKKETLKRGTALGWIQKHLKQTSPKWHLVSLDAIVITCLILLANFIFDEKEMGWQELNPNPYLLIPLLVGCRYGFIAGILSGLFAAITVTLLATKLDFYFIRSFIDNNLYLLFAFFVVGALIGEIQGWMNLRFLQKNFLLENAHQRLKELDEELYLVREGKDELEQKLATLNADVSTLDYELRRLCQCSEAEIYPNILTMLSHKHFIEQAAIYMCPTNRQLPLERIAYVGLDSEFPEHLSLEQSPILEKCLKEQDLIALPEMWSTEQSSDGIHDDFLLSVPFMSKNEDAFAVLVIGRMPLSEMNQSNMHSINLICRWAARLISERANTIDLENSDFKLVGPHGNTKIFCHHYLDYILELSFLTQKKLQLPASLLLFYSQSMEPNTQHELEEILSPQFRYGDLPAVLENPTLNFPNIALLLPLTGQRGAELCLNRIVENISSPNLQIEAKAYQIEDFLNKRALYDQISHLHLLSAPDVTIKKTQNIARLATQVK